MLNFVDKGILGSIKLAECGGIVHIYSQDHRCKYMQQNKTKILLEFFL